jgi:ATP-dependent helicase/nuclease subunit B
VKQRSDFVSCPQDFTDDKIKSLAQQIGQSLRNEVLLSNARNQYLLEHVERTLGQVINSQREAAKRGKFKPWKTELGFGIPTDGADLVPAFPLTTPNGKKVELYGKIDRVDLIEEQAAFAVIDYKLSGSRLMLESVYHGLSLQLLTYLLVLQKSAKHLGKPSLTPAAAFYVKLLRTLEMVDHPDEAKSPDEPAFHLKEKPRGVFDRNYLPALDGELLAGNSDVVQVFLKKDGGVGKKSDAVEPATFAGLLKLVEQKLGELADQIILGDIKVAPYRIGTATPCPRCDYRSICRFDPARQPYRKLEPIDRDQVIEKANELGGGAARV